MKILFRNREVSVPSATMPLLNSKFTPFFIFIAGFLWDVFTLNRIDNPIDNLILGSYLLMAGVCLIIAQGVANGRIVHRWAHRWPRIWNYAVQFFLGGLFSCYVVYYFQSTTISSTLFFIILMIFLLIANEFLPRRMGNIYFQIGLLTIAAFSYFIYLIPVLLKVMGTWVFLLSGLVSLLFISGVVVMLIRMTNNEVEYNTLRLWLSSGSVYVLILVLYFFNLIPPIPLAAKHVGAYVGYERTETGYRLQEAEMGFMNTIRFWEEKVPYSNTTPLYFFASIFAPNDMPFTIVHHWQQLDTVTDTWKTVDRIKYTATGGRDGGYRGASMKSAISPGLWRVDIEDERGFVVARTRIRVEETEALSLKWIEQ